MIYQVLFWAMCAVLAALVAVAIIAVAKAYRDERLHKRNTESQKGTNTGLVSPVRTSASGQKAN